MANSKLKNKYFKCPQSILKKMSKELATFKGDGNNSEGYSRAKKLIKDNGKVTYEELKRIKNFFDNTEHEENDIEYRMNGGEDMKKWVENTLNTARNAIYYVKKSRMDAGEENMFKKTHSKDKAKNPTKVRIPKPHKGDQSKYISGNKVAYENLQREMKDIKYLMEYLSNKNNKEKII